MKSRKGNAYIMVMIATMAMLTLISVVLLVTVSSRDTTARYSNFMGLYDLAIAGNEQVLFLLQQGILQEGDLIYPRDWNIRVSFVMPDGSILEDGYSATTIISAKGDDFEVETNIGKYVDGVRGHSATVAAQIIGTFSNYLDDYTFTMVELMRR